MKILAQAFELNKQNAKVYSTLSGENRALKKQLEDYHFHFRKEGKKIRERCKVLRDWIRRSERMCRTGRMCRYGDCDQFNTRKSFLDNC